MPVRQGYNNVLGQYRQQVLARLEAASRRGAPQTEIRRLQAELRAIGAARPTGMGAPGGVLEPPVTGTPEPPAPPYPTGTRLPPWAPPMATRRPTVAAGTLPTLDPSTLWGGATPRTAGVPPPWAGPAVGALGGALGGVGGLPGAGGPIAGGAGGWVYPTDPYEQAQLPPQARYWTEQQFRDWVAGVPGPMTQYQSEQVRQAQERIAQQRLEQLMDLATARLPTSYQRGQLGLSQEKFAYQQQQDMLARQLALQNLGMRRQEFGLEEKGLAQARMIALQQLAQAQRELAAAIGSQLVSTRGQTWAAGLPAELPRGTQFAPGMGPGGPASRLAQMGGAQFTPMRIAPSPPPSPQELMTLVQTAMRQFA